MPSLQGGCHATLDLSTCHLTAACEIETDAGTPAATFSVDYHFTGSGYDGSLVAGYRAPVVATPCQMTYNETGKKL